MAELKIASMNVRGIGNNNKRREAFNCLRNKQQYSGLLTGCAVVGPHNSIKAAQSRTISENPRNPAQYGKIWLKM